jgi:hypothetical protein
MSPASDAFVERYLTEMAEAPVEVDRLVDRPSGLDAVGMMEALDHDWFKQPGRQPIALQMMCDFMAPAGSVYFDAIYGDFRGQSAIRNWLLPTMASIDFIEFVPTAAPVLFDDGLGGTSLDEWQMFAKFGDDTIPLSPGVSVRRFRDGWITWSCDVYDTAAFRVPNPDPSAEAAPLPDWPRTHWETALDQPEWRFAESDVGAIADEFAADAVYVDPVFGEIHGRDAIRSWLTDLAGKVGNVVFEPLGPRLDNGTVSVAEWLQMAVHPDGQRTFMTRGTSVRRREGGEVVSATDYFDTAPFADPSVQAASRACGATLTLDDVMRYRGVGT